METERIGVVGAGVIGSEIAQVAATAGCEVTVVDTDEAAVTRGIYRMHRIGSRRVVRGRLSQDEADALLRRVTGATHLDALANADVIVEAGPEVLERKRELWRALDTVAKPGALLASNTSGLSITALARETGRPGRVMGLHLFNPASVMRLVDVIRLADTDEATVARSDGRFAPRPVLIDRMTAGAAFTATSRETP